MTTALHVVLVVKGMHPRSGGPPAVVAGSAEALANLGHQVTILTSAPETDRQAIADTWSSMLDAGVSISYLRDGGVRGFVNRSPDHDAIGELVAQSDVVHLHGIWGPILTIAARAAQRHQRPYVVSPHGMLDHRAMGTDRLKLLKKRIGIEVLGFRSLLNNASALLFGNEAEANQSWRPRGATRITYVPNGVSALRGLAEPTDADLALLRAAVPQTSEWNQLVLCRSRIDRQKGIDLLVKAFAQVGTDHPHARLLIAGIRHDEDYETHVKDLINDLGLHDTVAFTTELVGPSSQFLYSVADVVATPSIFEGFSVGLIEGLAFGRPMLVTRPCHMGIVEQHGSGVVVEAEPNSIATGLKQLLALSDDERRSMGQASRRLFEENYTWAKVAQMLATTYGDAIAQAGGR